MLTNNFFASWRRTLASTVSLCALSIGLSSFVCVAAIAADEVPVDKADSELAAPAPRSIVAENLAQAKISTQPDAPNLVTADTAGADDTSSTQNFTLPPMSGRLIAQATPDNVLPLEENTKAILLKLIELEKYNLNYHLNVAKQGRWKGWRYFTSQELNNMISGAGNIVGTAHRFSHLGNPSRLHRTTLENGNVLSFVGQTVGASGSAVEFLINLGHDVEARAKGYSPRAARDKVLGIRKEIDRLMVEREKIIRNMSASGVAPRYIEMARAEDPVLMDIRNLSLNEFKQFHTHLRRVYAFQQSLYFFDIMRNICGASGNRLGWDAIMRQQRHFNNSAGVMYNISGGITVFNPFLSRGIGKLVGEYHEWYIRKCMQGVDSDKVDADKLNADIANLKLVANSPELEQLDLPVLRTALYADHETGVRSQVHLEEKELRAGVLTAAENVVSGTILGSAGIGAGAIFNVAGTGFVHSSKGTNQLLAAANTVALSARMYGFLETLRIQVKREFEYHKFKKKHELPGQIMKDRLAALDKMEKQLKAN